MEKKWSFFHSILEKLFLTSSIPLKRLSWPLQDKKTQKLSQNFRGLQPHCDSPCFLQSQKKWGMTDKIFWTVYLILIDLYMSTVPHLKDEFTISQFLNHYEAFRSQILSKYLKIVTLKIQNFFVTNTQKLGFDRKYILKSIFSPSWAKETYCTSF